ncbi:hypothetical protein DMB66_54100 [Actinoplanes sp. ATCC 53533]|uniref:hypothetical protein n=1 Tax=Actinoplanes sp. ATCC 53533 TaxID=1288362 RepID=UPI000F7846FA|nr:hypothetical protein [Actinoplanes sp. ATCC 53533]RSM42890.1 hypothetical protein DMB66_54100 [Actinoplanes sp. ATCC 53533]
MITPPAASIAIESLPTIHLPTEMPDESLAGTMLTGKRIYTLVTPALSDSACALTVAMALFAPARAGAILTPVCAESGFAPATSAVVLSRAAAAEPATLRRAFVTVSSPVVVVVPGHDAPAPESLEAR